VPVLVVADAIVSASSRPVEVPQLRLSIRNSTGHEVYTWSDRTERNSLAPGETLTFRSRLGSPEPRGVVLCFLGRSDPASDDQRGRRNDRMGAMTARYSQ
jgi:hypothetical protein